MIVTSCASQVAYASAVFLFSVVCHRVSGLGSAAARAVTVTDGPAARKAITSSVNDRRSSRVSAPRRSVCNGPPAADLLVCLLRVIDGAACRRSVTDALEYATLTRSVLRQTIIVTQRIQHWYTGRSRDTANLQENHRFQAQATY